MPHKPTPQQQAIIDFIQAEPETNLMINAVAGAAKTSTMVMAAEHIGEQFSPLAVAFNKKIAEELTSRLPPHFTCKTLNALGHQAWARARGSSQIRLDADKLYKIVKAQNIDVAKDEDAGDKFAAVLALTRAAKSAGLIPTGAPLHAPAVLDDTRENWNELAFAKGLSVNDDDIIQARKALLRSIDMAFKGEIDFDDQIYMSTLFGGVYAKHHTVIVDETQDLSPLNHIQLRKLTGTRLIAVGDPYQAIYAFRGADSNSMENLAFEMGNDGFSSEKELRTQKIGKGKFHELMLTNSFRVPKLIGARQREHVAHFDSMDFLPDGEVHSWPLPQSLDPADVARTSVESWSIADIPTHAAVLCRNNAPLMKLAFIFIKSKRPVVILGRDIGAALASTLLKITGKESRPTEECFPLLRSWLKTELAKVDDSESKRATLYDRHDAIHVLLDSSGAKDNLAAADFVRQLFSDKAGPITVFSSGHRSKGLEWDWVLHLDPFRVPAEWAVRQAVRGNDRPLMQELNLRYVIETRSKHTLVEANLGDCLEYDGIT